jgi:hypothetical protein
MTSLLRPGRAWLRLRQKYGHGLRVAWYRDVVRPRIVGAEPVRGTTDASRVEVHVLTSKGDWLNLCWVLKSFYHFADVKWALCIHEDGSVPPEGLAALGRLFPDARLIRRAEADAAVLPVLDAGGFGRCAELRRTNVLSLKVFDFAHYLSAPRMLLLDSDVLFFARPDVLIERALDPNHLSPSFNMGTFSAYTVPPDQIASFLGFEIVSGFNSGLGVIPACWLDLELINQLLSMPHILSHPWRIEQTIYAVSASRLHFRPLPRQYDVTGLPAPTPPDHPVRHYVGPIRHLMYAEGIRRLQGRLL